MMIALPFFVKLRIDVVLEVLLVADILYIYNLSTIAKIKKEEQKLKKFELKIKHIKNKITKWVDTLWCIFEKDEKKGKIEVKGPKKAQFYNVFGERKIHIKIGMIDL